MLIDNFLSLDSFWGIIMARVSVFHEYDIFDQSVGIAVADVANRHFIRVNEGISRTELFGNFTYSGIHIGGTLQSYQYFEGGILLARATNINVDYGRYNDLLFTGGAERGISYLLSRGDYIRMSSGDDRIGAYNGNDRLKGLAGDDTLSGGRGNDTVFGNSGDDQVFGNGGADLLRGGGGNDRLFGGSGHDRLLGQAGNDKLVGGGGNDRLNGGGGDDVLRGGVGSDFLIGKGGADRIIGGGGNDRIAGGAGDDVLTGGQGADRFIFNRGDGTDTIRDFQHGVDQINIGRGANSFSQLDISRDGFDTVIEFADVTIIVEDELPRSFSAADFIF